MPIRTLFILGTRPEAVKLCPVIRHLRQHPEFHVDVCATAQHREMLDAVLNFFEVTPDYDLNVMAPGQTLYRSTSRIIGALEDVFAAARPDVAIVQGDTTTTFCGALAAFYAKAAVAHVEAGLRTGNMLSPFPEEMNRVLTTRLTTLHLAPTGWAAGNLTAEGVPEAAIAITGNPGIDAVLYVRDRLAAGEAGRAAPAGENHDRRTVLVTAHRRESFGEGFERICSALERLAAREDVRILYPVHPNPNVRGVVERRLGGVPNVDLIDPLDYVPFVDAMRHAYLILSDSGGVQEEAPSLGKPVLVLRENTERPEGVDAGTVKLVGTDVETIVKEANRLLDDPDEYGRMARMGNPYGDGHASERIAEALLAQFERRADHGQAP
ncbi:MAG TPA: UDP-N-acetylglucosamine 2-epimerase (non-hydrolyzing) [Bryobacteraceae bacterium]|nr:UDP-N-acetylglucosamine 2-epimerase (non-hydrolyzing) [Bryobacteraceae bacterium]